MVNEWLPSFRQPIDALPIRPHVEVLIRPDLRTNHINCQRCTLRLGDLWAMLWITMYKR